MASELYFFHGGTLALIVGSKSTRLMHNRPQVAQLTYGSDEASKLLQVDNDNSVLGPVSTGKPRNFAPYGHQPDATGELRSGLNGEPLDVLMMGYHLGQGKRFYSPQRRSFFSPDPTSPFGGGGINAYTYCGGDPVNNEDPTGLTRVFRFVARRLVSLSSLSSRRNSQVPKPSYSGAMRLSRNDNADSSNELGRITNPSMHQGAAQLNQPQVRPYGSVSSLLSTSNQQRRDLAPTLPARPGLAGEYGRQGWGVRWAIWWDGGHRRRTVAKWASLPGQHPGKFVIGAALIGRGIVTAVLLTRKSE